jgi:NADH:ubiquinone oxidoreductase subunit D
MAATAFTDRSNRREKACKKEESIYGVEQLPHVDGAGRASWICVRQQILDYLPAFLAEVGGVAFDAFAVTFFASHFVNGL